MQIIPIVKAGAELIETEKEPKIGVYYVSNIYSCLRQNYYSYFNKAHYNFETHNIFSKGNALHSLVQNSLIKFADKYDLKIENEVPNLYYKINDAELHGRLDSLLTEKDGTQHIVEIKTTKNLAYTPVPTHFYQLNYYLYHYKAAFGHLLYVNRTEKSYKDKMYEIFKEYPNNETEKPIRFNQELFDNSISRTLNLDKYLKKEELPPPEAKLNPSMFYQCLNCPFKKQCDDSIILEQTTKFTEQLKNMS